MASQAPNMLPLLYNGLEPLNRNAHGNFHVRRLNGLDRVAVIAFDGATPVTGATATVNVYQEGGEGTPIVLFALDDGVSPDAAPGDGLYSTQMAAFPAGQYLVEAVL